MKVYVVMQGGYDDYGIDAIFATRAAAKRHIRERQRAAYDKARTPIHDLTEWQFAEPYTIGAATAWTKGTSNPVLDYGPEVPKVTAQPDGSYLLEYAGRTARSVARGEERPFAEFVTEDEFCRSFEIEVHEVVV